MKNLIFSTALVTALIGLTLPAVSDSHSGSETTTLALIDTVAVATLLTNWEAETDVLTKAAIAKEIQAALGVTVDGLIGRKTISAIKAAGISTEFTKPTRAENGTAKLAIAVSDGTLTQEQANVISAGQVSIKKIQDKAKVGSLTKDAAKAQIEAIRLNIAVTSGRLTKEQADIVTQEKALITEIKDKVKAGDLTKNEAKTQISAVRDTMPAKSDRDGASGHSGKGAGSKGKKKKK